MSHKVLPALYFTLIVISDLPLASWLNNNNFVSFDCHTLLHNTTLLPLVIAFIFVVLYPGCQRLFCSDKQETHFFCHPKITSGTQGNANVCLGGNVDLCSYFSFFYVLFRSLKAVSSARSHLFSRIENRKCDLKCSM